MKSVRDLGGAITQRIADLLVGCVAMAAVASLIITNEPFSITATTFRDVNPCPSIQQSSRARDSSIPCPGYTIVPAQPKNHREWSFKWAPIAKPQPTAAPLNSPAKRAVSGPKPRSSAL
ncbi:MAG TPA: hypothetical protein VL285_19720 [Bryobacteraceae bacterium]|nr:hypothetical protein [Bryobacteraceae bacterium]